MKKKIIDCINKSSFQWEQFRLKQNYDNDEIKLFIKNYEILSAKEKKHLNKKIKENGKKIIIGDIKK